MLSSKERSKIKSVLSTEAPITQIGKNGLSSNFYESVAQALEKREAVKITVLKNSEKTPDEYLTEIANVLKAEAVAAIGNKILLYKKHILN